MKPAAPPVTSARTGFTVPMQGKDGAEIARCMMER